MYYLKLVSIKVSFHEKGVARVLDEPGDKYISREKHYLLRDVLILNRGWKQVA